MNEKQSQSGLLHLPKPLPQSPATAVTITASAPVTDPRAPGPMMAKTILQGSNGEAEAQHGSEPAGCHGYCVPASSSFPGVLGG